MHLLSTIAHDRLPKASGTRRSCQLARILVPLDFSPASKNALDFAAMLARAQGARLILLHVVGSLVSQADFGYGCVTRRSSDHHVLKASQARLGAIAKKLAHSGVAKPVALVRTGAAETEIVQTASDLAADLIVLGGGGSGTARLPLVDIVQQVVQHAPCSVLVTRKKHPSQSIPPCREPWSNE